jgi:uncharacterized protein (TIGR00288 family)
MDHKPRIALLIDADNAPATKIDLILNELSTLGETNIRRAYGNWTKDELKGWTGELHENAIRPMQQYDLSRGKNASDIAMVVDAIALLYTDRPDAFAIVSSDADFTPLVMHLREKGLAVYGFGSARTPKPFVSACSRFLYLEHLKEDSDEVSATPRRRTAAELRGDTKLVRLLRNAVQGVADDDGWARVSTVGQVVGNQSSLDSRNYGYAKLSKLIAATDLFEVRDQGKPSFAVRDRRASAPGKA